MNQSSTILVFLILLLLEALAGSRPSRFDPFGDIAIRMRTDEDGTGDDGVGTRWAVLVAGSNGYGNYRHQADVCHAYQILKRGGLKDENIVVFMYDDIAHNQLNPRPGVVINHPQGPDVYAGVPKDYTGESVTAANLFAVLLGDKNAVQGGSGKVVSSKADDRIFIYYSDHGGPGVLGMPNLPFLFAKDFLEVLKMMHAAERYREMVIYVEACESGSIFEGLMPKDLNIYVTTASNAEESSWGTYCPGMQPAPPPEYITCLGDLYSVAWMEDSESHNLKRETIKQQYQTVKDRASNYNTYAAGSHVMEYGNTTLKAEKLYLYQGFDPATENLPPNRLGLDVEMGVINQRDADLLFLWERLKRSKGSIEEKDEILREIRDTMEHRSHLDTSIELLGALLFGPHNAASVLTSVRSSGLPLVDDWDCLKSMVRIFERNCGSLTQYGMKYMRAFANICNNGISQSEMEKACSTTCRAYNSSGQWYPFVQGYSA